MRKHSNSPENIGNKNSTKDKEIALIPEPYFPGFVLVGVWKKEVELAALVLPVSVWMDKTKMLEIVNEILIKTLNKTGRWK
jgi:hypothetical protein